MDPHLDNTRYNNVMNVGDGILLGDSDNLNVSGCRIFDNHIISTVWTGVDVIGENNSVYQNVASGISISGQNNFVYQNNVTATNSHGIYVSSSNSTVSNNYIFGSDGIIIDSCCNVTIAKNNIYDNSEGINLRWNGHFCVYGNNIINNRGFGIEFGEGCSSSIVFQNNIINNSVGIDLYNFALFSNTISTMLGSGNIVYSNNLNNSQNVFIEHTYRFGNLSATYGAIENVTDAVSWNNSKVGNYWSDYLTQYPEATEINHTGIGNTPYVIDQNNSDNYPLWQPVINTVNATTPTPTVTEFQVSIIPMLLCLMVAGGLLVYFKKHKAGKIE